MAIFRRFFWLRSLNFQIALSAILGVGFGVLAQLGRLPFAVELGVLAQIMATFFTSLLKMVLMPLVFLTVSSSILHLRKLTQIHRVWGWTLGYFVTTILMASTTGLLFVNWIKPGVGVHLDWLMKSSSAGMVTKMSSSEMFLEFMKNSLQNPISAIVNHNVLALVIFAIVFGIGILSLKKKADKVADLVEELASVMLWLVHRMMIFAPLGVFGLLYRLAATQNMTIFNQLGLFIAVVFAGTLWHGFVNLPLVLWVVARKNPFRVLWDCQRPLIMAFSTSSSSATLPVTLDTIQNKLNLEPNLGAFVTTLGATLNMDGTALYEAMAALFIANLLGVELSILQQCVVIVVSSLASIGAPGIPSAGMVTMIMVLQAVGLPAEAVILLLPMDRLLDTVRTMVNVEGDMVGAVVVDSRVKYHV